MTRKGFFYIFMVPAFGILFFLAFYPLGNAVYYSLHDWDLRLNSQFMKFVGLANYQRLATDSRFINSLKTTAIWVAVTVLGATILGGGILAPLFHGYTGRTTRTICLLFSVMPALLPRVGAAYMWRLMYSPSIGIINYFLSVLGVRPIDFLAHPSYALFSVALIDVWQWGFLIAALMVILIEEIPREVIEAGALDGARMWQIYRYLIFPIVLPPFLPLLFVKLMESLRTFDFIFVLTAGGPGTATETLDMYAYWQGIGSAGRISYASSMSVVMLVITMVFVTFVWRRSARWRD